MWFSYPINIKEQGLLQLIPMMGSADRAAVVLFGSWAYKMGPLTNNKALLTSQVFKAMNTGTLGGTNIEKALKVAEKVFDDPDRKRVVWLLTDGVCAPNPMWMANKLKASGVSIVTIGLGSQPDMWLLTKMATDGAFSIKSAAEIPALYTKTWAKLVYETWLECGPDGWVEKQGDCGD